MKYQIELSYQEKLALIRLLDNILEDYILYCEESLVRLAYHKEYLCIAKKLKDIKSI